MTATARCIALLSLCAVVSACGVTASSRNPGYADIDIPRGAGLTRDTAISLGPIVLGFAARHAGDDPSAMAMLRALDGVRVRVYRVGPKAAQAELQQQLNRSVRRLSDTDWQIVMRVVEDDSIVHMLIREEGDELLGLTLISADDEELVLVNVMGHFDDAMLNALANTLDGDALALNDSAP